MKEFPLAYNRSTGRDKNMLSDAIDTVKGLRNKPVSQE